MADQQMRTQLVLEAKDAMDKIKELDKALRTINDITLNKIIDSIANIGKASQNSQTQVSQLGENIAQAVIKAGQQAQKNAETLQSTVSKTAEVSAKSSEKQVKASKDNAKATDEETKALKTYIDMAKQKVQKLRETYTQNQGKINQGAWKAQLTALSRDMEKIAKMEEKIYGASSAYSHWMQLLKSNPNFASLKEIDNILGGLAKKMQEISHIDKTARLSAKASDVATNVVQRKKEIEAQEKANSKALNDQFKSQKAYMERLWTENQIKPDKNFGVKWEQETNKLAEYARQLAEMKKAFGDVNGAANLLKHTLDMLKATGNNNIGLSKMLQELQPTKTKKFDTSQYELKDYNQLLNAQKKRMRKLYTKSPSIVNTKEWEAELKKLRELIKAKEQMEKAIGTSKANAALKTQFKDFAQLANSQRQRMQNLYTKNPNIINTTDWQKEQQKFVDLTTKAANMKQAIEGVGAAVKYMEKAFNSLGNNAKVFGLDKAMLQTYTNAELAKKALNDIKDQAKEIAGTKKSKQAPVDEKTLANEKARKQALKEEYDQRVLNAKEAIRMANLTQRERQRAFNLANQYKQLNESINQHKGDTGLSYTARQYDNLYNKLIKLRQAMENFTPKSGITFFNDFAKYIDPKQMLSGVNVRGGVDNRGISTLKKDVASLNEQVAKYYNQWVKTGDVIAHFNFKKSLQQLKQAEREAEKLERKLKRAFDIKKIPTQIWDFMENRAKWAMTGMFSNLLWEVPSEVISSYVELERAMAGVQQVMDAIEGRQGEVNKEFEKLNEIAAHFGTDMKDVVEAAQLWGRGYGHADYSPLNTGLEQYTKQAEAMATTNELVRQSAILATVDNFSMAESVRGLEAVLAAYDMRARSAAEATLFAGRAVDIITKVSHRGQISAQELVQGLQATGKAAEQAGVSLSFLTALIETGVRNTGMSGSNIGNAIKSMMVGLQSDKAIEEMKKFGVDAYKVGADGTKQLRPMQEVILEIAAALQTGDVNAKNLLLRISGGKMQFSKVSAILKDGAEIIRMWGEAADSAGFAQQQLEIQMNTFAVKLGRLKADITQLFQDVATSGAGDALKNLADALHKFFQDIHNGAGYVQAGGLTLGAIVGIKALGSTIGALRECGAAINRYKELTKSATGAEATRKMALDGVRNALGFKTAAEAQAAIAEKTKTGATQVNTIAETQNTTATSANTGAKVGNTAASGANTGAQGANTIARKANTAAINAQNLAETRGAAAMTIRTAGLNLLLAAVIGLATGYAVLGEHVNNTDKIFDENGNIINHNTDAINENYQMLQQQVQAQKDMETFIEQGSKMFMTYKKAVDDVNTSEEKRQKLLTQMEAIKSKFISMMHSGNKELDAENAQMLQNAQTAEEYAAVFDKLKTEYAKMTEDKKKKLIEAKQKEIEYFKTQKEIQQKYLEGLKAQTNGFEAWTKGQIHGINIVARAWASFAEFWVGIQETIAGGQKKMANMTSAYADKLEEALKNEDIDPATRATMEEQLANARANTAEFENKAKEDEADATRMKNSVNDMLQGHTEVWKSAIDEATRELAKTDAEIARLENEVNDLELFNTEGDTGDVNEDDKKGKKSGKGHKKKQQIMYSTDVEKAIHNMMADGSFSDDGWTHSLLKALVDYNGGNIADLSKISSKIEEYFRPEANKSDPMEIAYAFQQFALNNSKEKGWEGVIEQLYGAAADTVKAKLKNDAEWIDNNFTWKNSYKGIYGEESTSVKDAVQKALAKGINYGNVGCVRAALDISQLYSEFAKDEFEAGVANVRVLLQHAREQGVEVSDFDESKLKVGDLITWRDNSADPRDVHVGVFTGYKDGKAMVADNSSGKAKAGQASLMERELYRSWQTPDHIIHTGGDKGNKIPWVNSRKKDSIYEWDGDRKNRADNKVKEQYKWQQKVYEIEVERAKLEQEFTGDTISYQKAINQLRELHIKQMSNYIDETQEAYDKGMASLNAYINNSKTIQAALKRAKVTSFDELSEAEQKDLLNMNAKNGDDRAKNAVKIYEMLKQIKEELPKAKVNLQQEKNALRSDNGYMKPEDRYKWQKQLVNDWDATSHDNRLLQADRNLELDLIELQRLEVEIAKAKQAEEAEINKKLAERLALETEIAKLNQKETLTDKDKEKLEGLNATYKELGEYIDNLRTNHSKTYRDIAQQYNQQTKATKESIKAVRDVVNEYKQAGADITVDFFDKLINEGSSLGDAIEDLRKEIAKIAIKWFTYKAFNLPINNETFGNSPLETLLVHSQNKGEQDLTPMGLNTTATDLNTQELRTLNQQIASGKLNIANISQNNPFSTGITNPVATPAITAYSNSMQAVGEQMNNPLGTVLQNLGSHLTQISSTMSQFLTQKIQELPIEQQKLLLEQQGLSLEQFNQAVMTENAIAAQTNTQAQLQNATSTDLNTQAINTASAKTSAGGGGFGAFNILGFLPMLLAWLFQGDKKGGSLDKFAKGGKPTNGLIKGAGTGTSDSILTYLEHKRKFIRTSDGEYIINAKATDKLGVGTLDAINKNPELFNEMLLEKKGLATGGGVDMTPTMKPSTAQTYKSYTQTKAQLSNPNGRMEELMAEQNGLILGIGKGNDGRIVVLNTQADSNAVMKAIHDNPKAFRNLLGQQQKKGFR